MSDQINVSKNSLGFDEQPAQSHMPGDSSSANDAQATQDRAEASASHTNLEDSELVVITGMSGAGRTEAMHTFEDMGYYCIDNLPPSLLMSLIKSKDVPRRSDGTSRIAVVCDAREAANFAELLSELRRLHKAGFPYSVLFLDANDQTLTARYKASRRRHPLATDGHTSTLQAIHKEREVLADLRGISDLTIDTSGLRPIELRRQIRDHYSDESMQDGMSVIVYSFGFKHGPVLDADIVIDVRFLPNPYYDPQMRHLTGLDKPVRDFVLNRPETKEFLATWKRLLSVVMPGYVAEGKQQLIIAVGCTGGQHRSVVLAQKTGEYLKSLGYRVHIEHRDLNLAETHGGSPSVTNRAANKNED